MSSWGNNDNAANAPYWAVNSTIAPNNPAAAAPTSANVTLLYGNTTPDVYTTGETIGLFMVNSTEEEAGGDNITDISIIQGGTQYVEAPTVTIGGVVSGGGSGAAATASVAGGVVTQIAITNTGSSYETIPDVVVANPTISMVYTDVSTATDVFTYSGDATLFNNGDAVIPVLGAGTRIKLDTITFANTAISANVITATNPYVLGDYVVLTKNSGTVPTGLSDGGNYFVIPTGTGTFKLADSYAHALAGQFIQITDSSAAASLTLTANITTDKPYYVIVTGDKTFKLARTYALATAGSPTAIDITNRGTGNDKGFINQTATAATAVATKGLGAWDGATSGFEHAPHAGWNIKTLGSGGRAGRVQWETLVALSTVVGDGSDDITLPDA